MINYWYWVEIFEKNRWRRFTSAERNFEAALLKIIRAYNRDEFFVLERF